MSADNWAACPRCRRQREDAAIAASEKATKAYGQVPVAEFDALRDEAARRAAEINQPSNDYTFREDYEIYGAEDGEISVSYSGSCKVCGLELHFEHTHPLDP